MIISILETNRSISTFDNDNDLSKGNCALATKSGNWMVVQCL